MAGKWFPTATQTLSATGVGRPSHRQAPAKVNRHSEKAPGDSETPGGRWNNLSTELEGKYLSPEGAFLLE